VDNHTVLEACLLPKSDLSFLYFVAVLSLTKLLNTNNMNIINNCVNILLLNCLILSGLIVFVGLRNSSLNVKILLAKLQSQFDSLHLPLSYVSLLSVFLFIFHVYLLPFLVNKDAYTLCSKKVTPKFKSL